MTRSPNGLGACCTWEPGSCPAPVVLDGSLVAFQHILLCTDREAFLLSTRAGNPKSYLYLMPLMTSAMGGYSLPHEKSRASLGQ